ncbi:NAD(P)-binding protein [Burkholderiaceae bacterium DAT-1]|nr:NAD(P)-binding protein [Burkholderiaceae bacterium DAT-1]
MSLSNRIAIIGAGMAGAACARALHDAGYEVVAFDKSRGTGGRLSTRRTPDWQADHGAPGFHAGCPDFISEVARWVDAGIAAPFSVDGEFVGVPQMNQPVKHLLRDITIRTGQRIAHIERNAAGQYRLLNESGEVAGEAFDAVISATPAEQAVPLLVNLSATLADLARSAQQTPCWVAMLSGIQDTPIAGSPMIDRIIANHCKYGRANTPVYVAYATEAWSVEHLEDSADSVKEAFLTALLPDQRREEVTCEVHRWRYARGGLGLATPWAWDASARIGLCGDWLGAGSVESAWLSGCGIANQFLAGN